jgi:hypothetical protein
MIPERTFSLSLSINSIFPAIHPPAQPTARKSRTGRLRETGWRQQMHAELDVMLDEIAAERKRAKAAAVPMPREP